jgi:hypothetical protein
LSPALSIALGSALLLMLLSAIVPRRLLARAQDRMARETLSDARRLFRLLTRADRVAGRYRRIPGLLGLTDDRLVFEGVFGEEWELSTSRVGKIETGRRLANGRLLLRLEVLRITAATGDPTEFVLTRLAAEEWRSHLGLWAMKERQADADRVVPGR